MFAHPWAQRCVIPHRLSLTNYLNILTIRHVDNCQNGTKESIVLDVQKKLEQLVGRIRIKAE